MGAWGLLLASTVAIGVLASLAALACWAMVPIVFGLGSSVVMSDSMAPGIRAGDVVVTQSVPAARVVPGQVLLVDDPDHAGRLRLHRLVAVRHGAFVLRGDANRADDSSPVPVAALHGVGLLRVPAVGLPVLWLRTGRVAPLAGLSAALVGLIVVADLSGAMHRRSRRHRVEGPRSSVRRRRALGAAGAVPVLLAALVLGPGGRTAEADARFQGVVTNAGDSFATQTVYSCLSRSTGVNRLFYWEYSEASGTTANDSSTSAHTGTLYNVTRVTGTCATNNSPSIDVSGGGWVSATDQYATTTVFSLATWFKLNSTSSRSGRLLGLATSATTTSTPSGVDRVLYLDAAGTVHFGLRMSGTPCDLPSSTAIADTGWHHVVATYSAANGMHLYLDGAPSGATSCAGTVGTPTGYWRAGYDVLSSSDWANAGGAVLSGLIDQTVAWDRELPASEASSLYTTGH